MSRNRLHAVGWGPFSIAACWNVLGVTPSLGHVVPITTFGSLMASL